MCLFVECVVPCSPQNSEACIIPPEAIVPCDVGLSERSVFSQPTPTKLGLDRLQELQGWNCEMFVF